MVAPHLPVQRAGLAPFDARDDEGWEAMAMREELTDMMLNSAFGEAIAIEVRDNFRGGGGDLASFPPINGKLEKMFHP